MPRQAVCLSVLAFAALTDMPAFSAEKVGDLRFRVQTLMRDHNEGCDIADFNKDGRLDVVDAALVDVADVGRYAQFSRTATTSKATAILPTT